MLYQLRTGALAALLLLPASLALAATDRGQAAEQQRAVAMTQERAFDLLSARRGEAQSVAFPAETDVSIFIGINVPSFVLEEVTLFLDGRQVTNKRYSRAEALLLHSDERRLDRVVRTNVEPGSHRVRLEFAGRLRDAEPDGTQLTGEIDLEFDKGEARKALILPAAPAALQMNRRLDPKPWQWREEAEDPRLALTRYLRARDQSFEAMIELIDMAAVSGQENLKPAYFALLAHVYLDFGMSEQAEQAVETYTRLGAEREPFEDIRLRLAELDLKRGNHGPAGRRLDKARQFLTPAQRVRWQDTLSRLQMAEGAFAQAAATLAGGENALEVITEVDDANNQSLTMRYNLAVAWLRSGEVAKGRTLLDRVGRLTPFTPAQRLLRDRANVLLGFSFLNADQSATAKHMFQRVRLHGPLSPVALLGLGRAEITPPGDRQQRVAIGDEPEAGTYGIADTESGRLQRSDQRDRFSADGYSKVQLGTYPIADIADEEEQQRQRALVAWQTLTQRNPRHEAVQEALVAIPYLLEEFEAYGAAQEQYAQAMDMLQAVRDELTRAIEGLESGEPVSLPAAGDSLTALGREWRRQALGDSLAGSRWVQRMLASNAFSEPLANIRRIRRLQTALTQAPTATARPVAYDGSASRAVAGQVDSRVMAMLDKAADTEIHRLASVAVDTLATQRKQLDRFLQAVRYGVARMHLRPALREQEEAEAEGEDSGVKDFAP